MSLLSVVEQAIKSCKAEQAKINSSIQHYRELLHTVTPQPKMGADESECADDDATDTDTSPGEKEDLELLEQALEKALRVRTGTGPSKGASNKQSASGKEPGTMVVTSKEGMQASSEGKRSATRSTSKSASLDRKGNKKPATSVSSKPSTSYNRGRCKATINKNTTQNSAVSSAGIVHHRAARKSQQAISASGSLDRGQLHTSALHSKNRTIRSNVLSGNDLGRAAAMSTPSNNTVPVSHTEESGLHGLPPQNGRKASDQTAKWKSLRSKQNRLWDKVAALQRKPVPGRSRFMERMRATFPTDWPCGCPDQTRALVNRLTHQGHDLAQRCQTKEPTELGGEVNEYDSCHERVPVTTAQLQNFAHRAKQEWEAWDRWRPEGGCLCPTGAHDGRVAPLPLTVTYKTEAELRELENLRMRVVLLQQQLHLEQALFDTLSPQLWSRSPGPGCPGLSVLRDVYSLLGEGGERFPAFVLDSESD